MISYYSTRRYWRAVCDATTERYREVSSTQGFSAEKFYDALTKLGNRGTRSCTAVPMPTAEDFLADVWLAAKSALSEGDFKTFKEEFLNRTTYGDVIGLNHIKEAVGRIFLSRRIYPESLYFREPVGQSEKRCACKSKEHNAPESSTVWCAGGCGLNTLQHSVGMFDQVLGYRRFFCVDCTLADEKRLNDEANLRREQEAA